MKKLLYTLLAVSIIFSACKKEDLDTIDPTNPSTYDYRLDKLTEESDGGIYEIDYEYDDIDKRYNSADYSFNGEEVLEIDFDYNSDGTVTEEQSYENNIQQRSVWKPNSMGGWNKISECFGNSCNYYIYDGDLLIEYSGEDDYKTLYFYDNNTLISDTFYNIVDDEIMSWSVYNRDGNVEIIERWNGSPVDNPILFQRTEKTFSGDNLMEEEKFELAYDNLLENYEFYLASLTTYTYKSYEAFSPPGFNMSGSAIDKIKLYQYDENGELNYSIDREYDYTEL